MQLESPAFAHFQEIPKRHTADGVDISPFLIIHDAPKGVVSFALIVDDPDAPMGTYDHWLVWNIPGETKTIPEGYKGPVEGTTSFGSVGYGGPSPPPGKVHRYFFHLFALDSLLPLNEGATKGELKKAITGHILDQTELVGTYKR